MKDLVKKLNLAVKSPYYAIKTQKWLPYSKLLIKSDNSDWVLYSIVLEMDTVCNNIGVSTLNAKYFRFIKNQSIYYTSKYEVLSEWKKPKNRIGFSYYHGDPSTLPLFKKMINNIEKHHKDISRIQVSHSHMEGIILNTGIDSNKVFRIPISIDLDFFLEVNLHHRSVSRKKLKIPEEVVLIGSFQKDGVGWKEGNEPKLIKGPDIFLQTIKILKDVIPDLHVLLTGPARGYVKTGLEKMGVPYYHYLLENYTNISQYYHALDLYIVTSREEGGPRSVLESMASGIPLVTTRVGQAMDLVEHKKNGWIVDVDDVEGLAYWSKYVIENSDSIKNIQAAARETAEKNCYSAQIPIWKKFMEGFVKIN